jgi:hypothetical protein
MGGDPERLSRRANGRILGDIGRYLHTYIGISIDCILSILGVRKRFILEHIFYRPFWSISY